MIYTTVSWQRLYIAKDFHYVGNVNSYNNCITQFFAWLFGLSMTVDFGGEEYSVDKRSYIRLINSIGTSATIENVVQYKIFQPNLVGPSQESLSKMRDLIDPQDSRALFRKLAKAIEDGNSTEATAMIYRGAQLDTSYYVREGNLLSFGSVTEDLKQEQAYSFNVLYGPPIVQAANKANDLVVGALRKAGVNSCTGKKYIFRRQILGVRRRHEIQPVWSQVAPGRYGYTLGLSERSTVHVQDEEENKVSYRVNGDNRLEVM